MMNLQRRLKPLTLAVILLTSAWILPTYAEGTAPVIVIGAGLAGSKVAYELSIRNIPVVIVEATDRTGGRMRNQAIDNRGNLVELGANWVQGCTSSSPFCTFVFNEVNPAGVKTNYNDVYFSEDGKLVADEIADPVWYRWSTALGKAYEYLKNNATTADGQVRSDLSLGSVLLMSAGWYADTPIEIAAQRFDIDFEYTLPPQYLSLHELNEFYDPNGERTYDYFVNDPRGMAAIVNWHLDKAGVYDPSKNDVELVLNAPVSSIQYGESSADVTLRNGTTIHGSAVVSTVSVGVLQESLFKPKEEGRITFSPELPDDKKLAISKFGMGDFVKFFLEFKHDVFTTKDPLFTIPLECHEGGWHTILNLNKPDYLPNQNIVVLFASAAYGRDLECMSEEERLGEALAYVSREVGRTVMPSEVRSVVMPRWFASPFFKGMYSYRPLAFTDEDYEALNRPLDRLFFAGEAHSYKLHGYMQGAWESGADTAQGVVNLLSSAT